MCIRDRTKTTGTQHKNIRMNPKAIRAEEMFGETNKASGEWVDGVFAAMWSKFNDRTRKDMQARFLSELSCGANNLCFKCCTQKRIWRCAHN